MNYLEILHKKEVYESGTNKIAEEENKTMRNNWAFRSTMYLS